MTKIVPKTDYLLIISHDPTNLFKHFDVHEMHGLNVFQCQHIEGLCNYIPKQDGNYDLTDPCFVFINTSKHTDPIKVFGVIMHEMMHMSFKKHQWNLHKEEDIITWAEEQAYDIYYNYINKQL